MIRTRRRLLVAGALTIGIGGAVLAPAVAAVASNSPGAGLRVNVKHVEIQARGAAVLEKIAYTCPAGSDGFIQVGLAEKTGHTVTQGGASQEVPCTGHGASVTVSVTSDHRPWVVGSAASTAGIQADFSGTLTENKTVKIVK